MKKMLLALITIAMLAMTASADLVDSDFTGTGLAALGAAVEFEDLDDGWAANKTTHWSYNAANDRVDYLGDGSSRAIGQLVSGASVSSDTVLNVYLSMDQGPTDLDGVRLHVAVWGFDGTGAIDSGADLLKLDNWSQDPGSTKTPVPAGYTATAVVDYDSAQVASLDYTTTPLSFTGLDLSAYEYVAVRVGFNSGELDNSSYISKVEMVPEPATVGMLGLGALVALLVRRIRA